MPVKISTPLTDDVIKTLKAGDEVLISGVIFTARDAAHKRIVSLIESGGNLPFDIKGQIIYFAGPTPEPPGRAIGSIGPTTSYRMDAYSPVLIEHGLKGMIGKGKRSAAVISAMKEHGAVYFAAVGGAGALISMSVLSSEVIAYPELGPEAVRKLVVKDLPAIVATDCGGNDLYVSGVEEFLKSIKP